MAKSLSPPSSDSPGGWFSRLFGAKAAPATSAPTATGRLASPTDYDDPRHAIRAGYMVIVLGLGSFSLWAVFAPIGEGVPAQGVVVTESHSKVISHLTGGTVAAVHVAENQIVAAGAPLIELDTTRAQTQYSTALNEYLGAAAKTALYEAEQTQARQVEFPDEVKEIAGRIGRNDVLAAAEQLFKTRREVFASEQTILHSNLAASQAQRVSLEHQMSARSQQEALLSQEIASTRELVDSGYTARNRLMELERQLAEIQSAKSELQSRIARENSTAAEIRLRILQRRQEIQKDIETQATEVRRDAMNLAERVKDAQAELKRTTIKAPVGGQIISLIAQAPGTVISPGARLMEIVPLEDKLLLDVRVPVHVIQRVSVGLETDIRITSFKDMPTLIVTGTVLSVSSDRHEAANASEQPYYLARVEISPEGMSKLGEHHMRPGMSTDVVIKTGERSFMQYIMAPFTRSLFNAFKEP